MSQLCALSSPFSGILSVTGILRQLRAISPCRENVFSFGLCVRRKRLVPSHFVRRFLIEKDLVAIQVFQHDSRPVWPHLRLALKPHGHRFQALVVAQAIIGSYAKKRKTATLLANQRKVAFALGHVQSEHRLVTIRQCYGYPSIGPHRNVCGALDGGSPTTSRFAEP